MGLFKKPPGKEAMGKYAASGSDPDGPAKIDVLGQAFIKVDPISNEDRLGVLEMNPPPGLQFYSKLRGGKIMSGQGLENLTVDLSGILEKQISQAPAGDILNGLLHWNRFAHEFNALDFLGLHILFFPVLAF